MRYYFVKQYSDFQFILQIRNFKKYLEQKKYQQALIMLFYILKGIYEKN